MCGSHADCTNTVGSYSCKCHSGYIGSGKSCSDVDECTRKTHNCSAQATCSNTNGGFTCACKACYNGNGYSCTVINCHQLKKPVHGSKRGNAVTCDSQTTFSCDSGYRLAPSGSGTLTCTSSGQWSPVREPNCQGTLVCLVSYVEVLPHFIVLLIVVLIEL